MNSKAQSGLEYLVTYGWALVIIAAVVGVLVFIVGGPASDVTFSSSDSAKIVVKGASTAGENTEIILQNITGGGLVITGKTELGYSNCTINSQVPPVEVSAGSQLILECVAPEDGKGRILLEYIDFADLEKTVLITASGTTEEIPLPSETILNYASGKSCSEICTENNFSNCQSIGTDATGISGVIARNLCSMGPGGNCEILIVGDGGSCNGEPTQWTNCFCSNETPTVILNSATEKNCYEICSDNGFDYCLSVGTNAEATGGMLVVYSPFGCLGMTGAGCNNIMDDSGGECAGNPANWINCRCSN